MASNHQTPFENLYKPPDGKIDVPEFVNYLKENTPYLVSNGNLYLWNQDHRCFLLMRRMDIPPWIISKIDKSVSVPSSAINEVTKHLIWAPERQKDLETLRQHSQFYINTNNGVIDIRGGKFCTNEEAEKLALSSGFTYQLDFSYNSEAMIQHIYGILSLRRTAEEIRLNIAYRWFLGYSLTEKTPHFSTFSYNFSHRFTEDVVQQIFDWILNEINDAGYLSPDAVFIDGTHIKANANMKKAIRRAVPEASRIYSKQLLKEINEDREDHGKKPFDGGNPPKEKVITESRTDPECGVFHKGEHKKCFAYAAQTACDKNGYILDVTVNAGNIHDSVAFDGLYERLKKRLAMRYVVADAGYKTPWICKRVIDDGLIPVLPYKRPMGKDGFFRPYEYIYDEYFDCVLCPENHVLSYSTTNRDGCREFKSKPYICENCPSRSKCTTNSQCTKTVLKHLWSDYLELAEDYRHTPKLRKLYDRRKETIERVFADAKEKHSMRFTYFRGLTRVTNWVRLKFAAMNLKKYVLHRWLYCFFSHFLSSFSSFRLLTALYSKSHLSLFNERWLFRQADPGISLRVYFLLKIGKIGVEDFCSYHPDRHDKVI